METTEKTLPTRKEPPSLETLLQSVSEQVQALQKTWEITTLEPESAGLKAGLKRMIHKLVAHPLRKQSNVNWALVSVLSSLEGALRQVIDQKAAQAEADRLSRQVLDLTEKQRTMAALLNDIKEDLARVPDTTMKIATLESRLGRLQRTGGEPASSPVATFTPPAQPEGEIDYFLFEAKFRGSRDSIRARHRMYLPYVEEQAPVLDIGCGRGEFLELVHNEGIACFGVDLNADMAEFCRSMGLDVQHEDAFSFLARQASGSLGAIFLGQVVEHMPPNAVAHLFEMALDKLRVGGLLIAETVNPLCPTAFANFFLDPTHDRPMHPELLMFLAESKGFQPVEYLFSSVQGELPALLKSNRGQPEGCDRYMDFAVICRRPAETALEEGSHVS